MKLFKLTILLAALVAASAFPTPQEDKIAEVAEESSVVVIPSVKLTKDAASEEVHMVQKIEIHVEVAAPSGMMMPATVRVSEVRKKVPAIATEVEPEEAVEKVSVALKYPESVKVPAVTAEDKPALKTPEAVKEDSETSETVETESAVEVEKPAKTDVKFPPEFIKVPPVEEESEHAEVAADEKVDETKSDETVKSEESAEKPVADQAAEETESVVNKAEEPVALKTDVVKDEDSSSKSEEDVKVHDTVADDAAVKVKTETKEETQEDPIVEEEVKVTVESTKKDDVKVVAAKKPVKKITKDDEEKVTITKEKSDVKPAEVEKTDVEVTEKKEQVESEVVDPSVVKNVPIVEDISTQTKNTEAEPVYKVIPVEVVKEDAVEVVKTEEVKESEIKAVEDVKEEETQVKDTETKEVAEEAVQHDETVKATESEIVKEEEPAKKVTTASKVIVKPAKNQDDESIVFVVHAKRPEADESADKEAETKVEDAPVPAEETAAVAADTEGSSIKAAAETETAEKKVEDKSDSESSAIKPVEPAVKADEEQKPETPVKVEGKKGNKKKLPGSNKKQNTI
ncbi:nucleolin-like isoform X2 [Uranotaenia lowii]|uniref:nucleolin-like isoform X2 n=1 Tax=Uranotaenia lowii TaxID=190385 RepID=UPI00247872EC|nr:nucleolin-like isoform X2 [Uranotaenia lowii]